MRRLSAYITTRVSDHLMNFLKIFVLAVALLTTAQAVQKPSAHTKGTPTGKPTGLLKPGEYWWNPQLSPSGPPVLAWLEWAGRVLVEPATLAERSAHGAR